jgi:hypothetical protein
MMSRGKKRKEKIRNKKWFVELLSGYCAVAGVATANLHVTSLCNETVRSHICNLQR